MKEGLMSMDARDIIKRFEALESLRQPWRERWRLCAQYVLPGGSGEGSRSAVFDSTASLALGRFASTLETMLTPTNQKWHSLATGNPQVDADPLSAQWCEALRDLMFRLRYAPEANFANQMMEAYISLGVYGTAIVFVDENPSLGLRYKCVPVTECCLAADASGRVDTVFRAYSLSSVQALAEFGSALPDSIARQAADPARQDQKQHFIHCVFPRLKRRPELADGLNMPWASVHLERSSGRIMRQGGYRVMPYAVSRFTVDPGEVYGRSPAMEVMPDIVMVNAMNKTMLRAAEKMVNPPLLVPEDDVLNAFSLKAGSLNYGGLDADGRQRVVPLQLGGNLPIGLEMINRCRETINEAFFLNLFQVLLENGAQKTATEVAERAREKAQLLAPTMGRQQSELLRGIIQRELDILLAAGLTQLLPPPPPPLVAAGGRLQPIYCTEITQTLAAVDGQAIINSSQALSLLAQVNPEVLDLIDTDAAASTILASHGVPASVIRNRSEVELMRRQRQDERDRQAASQLLNQSLAEAGAVLDLARQEQKLEGETGSEPAREPA